MDRNLALEFVRVTEAAAIASARWMGKGDTHKADDAAVVMMRKVLNDLDIDGEIVIGEGERDKAPMLYIGERVGKKGGSKGDNNAVKIDLAVDPLECTNSVAYGRPNAIAVLASAPWGTLLHAPDIYMDKIAVGPRARGTVDLDASVEENLSAVADALEKQVKDLTVVVLDRERHARLIKDIRACDARIVLIPDGDISGAIAPSIEGSGIDILMGIGAAPEGVIAAAGISALEGDMQGRLVFRDKEERRRAEEMGAYAGQKSALNDPEMLNDPGRKMGVCDMVHCENAMFAATGVSDGPFLKGVRFTSTGAITNSVVMRTKTKTVRFIEARHVFRDKPNY
ncbi:fructose-bisphosphatase class II [Candidatus Woesearchaeota archaeon CG_4_10_14_0_8_um_filter_47_5]|nr:MAG: fructose-bisphosphatase class II [Candidatus Woesearchaeota archaeon CG_4_10_14_0_8_um_filter_47_5]